MEIHALGDVRMITNFLCSESPMFLDLGVRQPRSDFYKDSVHPTVNGYQQMGKYFAVELKKHILCN